MCLFILLFMVLAFIGPVIQMTTGLPIEASYTVEFFGIVAIVLGAIIRDWVKS